MADRPAHVVGHVGAVTRAQQVAQVQHCLTILGATAGTPIQLCFDHKSITEFNDLTSMSVLDIELLSYPVAPNVVRLPRALQNRIKILLSLYYHWSADLGADINITLVTVANYDEYRIHGYIPGNPPWCNYSR